MPTPAEGWSRVHGKKIDRTLVTVLKTLARAGGWARTR
ncbi:hypothetical protein F4553_003481 [Allocatelliglobosispora scoriae]|uniref:Uncharacterized protein n=1 Tax=Allocatelliglobosispora scoriae TaxID=643052 RepID=A0A841BTM7_9ACTN|nr:hypothetical protein [Allocatelliglobosispora scoriae]